MRPPLSRPPSVDVGEMLPTNADSVAPLDAVITRDGETQVLAQVTPAEGVLRAGGDAPAGIALIRAGERL